jgi:AcrR family transcriptional regulator
MNKKEIILTEAKRLFGEYGYLGFTLKQLALACDMTAPALYYFYTSKADLFKDCLISEMSIRNQFLAQLADQSQTIPEFTRALVIHSFAVCGASHFRTGQAMDEIIHLQPQFQQELRAAWSKLMIAPVEAFLARTLPAESAVLSHCLLATYFINMATFAAAHESQFGQEELIALMIAVAHGLEETALASAQRA